MNQEKFSEGMRELFHGISVVFESLGTDVPASIKNIQASNPVPPEPEKKQEEAPDKDDLPMLTYDQVVNTITRRVNRALQEGDNTFNDRLRAAIKDMGYNKVSEMPAERYEEFLATISFM